jgi:hypothetical protein
MQPSIVRFVAACVIACSVGTSAKPSLPAAAASVPASRSAPLLVERGSYVNSDGARVHVPAHTVDGSIPAGASARCNDGSWSFSAHRRGTCSHHGGVAHWL